MLFTCMPVPGTTTPEHEPFEQVTEAQAPSASMTAMWVVLPEPRAHLRGHVVERVRPEEALEVALGHEPLHELLVAGAVGRGDHLGDHVGVVAEVEPLEDAERVGDQDAARRGRRVGEHRPAPVGHPGGLALDHLVGLEVLAREEAAALEHPVADRAGHVARVEEPGALGAEPVEQVAELGQADRLAGAQQAPAGRVELGALRRGAEDRLEHLEQEGLHRHDLHALARRPRRARGEVAEAEGCRSARARRRGPAWSRTRRRTRARR